MCHARDSAVIQIKSDNAIRSAAGRAIRKIQGAARRIDREAGSRADAALANLVRLASRNGYPMTGAASDEEIVMKGLIIIAVSAAALTASVISAQACDPRL